MIPYLQELILSPTLFFIQFLYSTSFSNINRTAQNTKPCFYYYRHSTLFFCSRGRIFGSTTAFIGTILVASQSNLLLSQAQEARHYAMFFACGAWVLYMLSFYEGATKKTLWITFLAHFCLCQIHYFGIIFLH